MLLFLGSFFRIPWEKRHELKNEKLDKKIVGIFLNLLASRSRWRISESSFFTPEDSPG